jgi:predicted nucleotidyltransferase
LRSNARPSTVGDALFGKTRQGVLSLLFGHPGKAFYRNQIARVVAGGAIGQVQRELERLTQAGLLVRETVGNQNHYRANPDSAVFHDLVALVTKTFGIADVLRNALDELSSRIAVAFIYGSVARGEHRAASDVDVLIIGDILLSDLDPILRNAEAALGRTISPTLLDEKSYRKRFAEDDHFLKTVLAGPKIFLIGDAAKLKQIRERRAR